MECLICSQSWLEKEDSNCMSKLGAETSTYFCKLLGLGSSTSVHKTRRCYACNSCVEVIVELKVQMQLLEVLEAKMTSLKEDLKSKLVWSSRQNSGRGASEIVTAEDQFTRSWRCDLVQELRLAPAESFDEDMSIAGDDVQGEAGDDVREEADDDDMQGEADDDVQWEADDDLQGEADKTEQDLLSGKKKRVRPKDRKKKQQTPQNNRGFEAKMGKELVIRLERISQNSIESAMRSGNKFAETQEETADEVTEVVISNSIISRTNTSTGLVEFCCALCPRTYSTQRHAQQHQFRHRERNVSCKLCPRTFIAKNELKRHMQVHSRDRPFQCTICPKTYRWNDDLKYHLRTVHVVDSTQIVQNEPCWGKRVESIEENTGESEVTVPEGVVPEGQQGGDEEEINIKEEEDSNSCDNNVSDNNSAVLREPLSGPSTSQTGEGFRVGHQLLLCIPCGNYFRTPDLFAKHFAESAGCNKRLKTHHSSKDNEIEGEENTTTQLTCSDCDENFPTSQALDLHLKTHLPLGSKSNIEKALVLSTVLEQVIKTEDFMSET